MECNVAEYMTQLPPKELLQGKLHASIERAKEKFELKEDSFLTKYCGI